MSLNIVVIDDYKVKHKTDIEELFDTIKIHGTEKERKIIELIEHGRYNDECSFIDRFGFKLRLSDLSTGCKAALCILNMPDKQIDTIECGVNAIDVIVSLIDKGNIIIDDRGCTFVDYNNNKIDVTLDNYRFTQLDRLNYYYFDERPYKPDLDIKGVKKICM